MVCSSMLHLPNSLLCHVKMSWNSSNSASICSRARLTLGLIFVLISIHLFSPSSSSFFSSIWTWKRKDASLVGLFVNCLIIWSSFSWTYWIQFASSSSMVYCPSSNFYYYSCNTRFNICIGASLSITWFIPWSFNFST